jgi:hypothetical protein
MSSPALIAGLQGVRRRVVYVSIYELIAIAVVTVGLSRYTGQDMGHSGVMAVVSSAVAVVWNILFNTLFERWEARQAVRGRSLRRRVAHAIGFEVFVNIGERTNVTGSKAFARMILERPVRVRGAGRGAPAGGERRAGHRRQHGRGHARQQGRRWCASST